MLAIGRALMSKPKMILLDEPSMGLAPQLVEEIFEIVKDLNQREGVSFLLAEHLGASGVFAALVAGVIVGNLGWRRAISENGRGHVLGFWEYAAFLANSLLFLMIGSHEAHQPLALVSGALAVVIALTLVGRAAAVYPIALLFRPTRLRLPGPYQHVLLWGGLRGAVGLALALAVPDSVPERGQIIVLAFGVVAFSIFLQGLTMPPLLRRWKLTGQDDPDDAPSA